MKSFSMFLEISLYSISSGIWWIIDFQIEIWGVSGPCVSVGRAKSLLTQLQNRTIPVLPIRRLICSFCFCKSSKHEVWKLFNNFEKSLQTLQKEKYFNFIFSEIFEIRHATFLWKIKPLRYHSKVTRVHDRLIFGGKTFLFVRQDDQRL